MTKKIIGSGGRRQQRPRQPTRAPDTLHSRQFATIQDLLSEGEIEGFSTPSKAGITNKSSSEYTNASQKDIFLNDTPLLKSTANNANPSSGDFNFTDVSVDTRFGTGNQTRIGGLVDNAGQPISVSQTVTQASGGVVKQIQTAGAGGTNPTALRIALSFPQIQHLKDNGDVDGSEVSYQIQIEYNGGGYNTVVSNSVKGRTADLYQRDHRIAITGAFPVNIKVVRNTADSSDSNLVNSFEFTHVIKLFEVTSTYPNSAYTQIRVDSKEFSQFPNRRYKLRGIKVRIPGAGANNSGTPTVDINTGRIIYPDNYIFNGTLQAATWCSCPSMVLLDVLTNSRYGFGDHITDANLDLFSFVEASKYSNELVDDLTGAGTQEARFAINANIQSSSKAFDLINNLAGVMRCNPIWQNGSIQLAQDRPTDASYLFSLSNVDDAGFSYTGASLKQRHTVISVAYFNMEAQEVDYEVVEDSAGITKFGHVIKQVQAFGCTSRGQAQRFGKAILFSEQQESELVTFQTSIDAGIITRVGSVIEVNDPVRAGARRGGRVVSATSTTLTIDELSSTTLPAITDNPKISVLNTDGAVEQKTITAINGAVLTVDSAFSITPTTNAQYLITSDAISLQKFRVISIEENDKSKYTIQALTYLEGKYANIEQQITLPVIKISNLNDIKDAPRNLEAVDKIAVINNLAIAKIVISWQPVNGVNAYQVNYRKENGNYITATVFRPDFEIIDSEEAKYDIEVYSVNAALQLSASPTVIEHHAAGKTGLPSDVQNLTFEPVDSNLIRLRWDKAEDPDVIHGGRVYVRHSSKTDGTGSFQNSTDLVRALAGTSSEAVVPALQGEYILKFQDDGGRFSNGEASVIVTLPDLEDQLQIANIDEDAGGFAGTKTNSSVVGGALRLTNPVNNKNGTYDFTSTFDLGSVFTVTFEKVLTSVGFYVGSNIDSRTELIDTWPDFDGVAANSTNVEMQLRSTEDNPSSSPTYTSYNQFSHGTFKGRAFQFRLKLNTDDVAQNVAVQQTGVKAFLKSRTETSTTVIRSVDGNNNAASKSVTFQTPFFTGTSAIGGSTSAYLPTINITIQNQQSGDFFVLPSISDTGFTVEIRNGGSLVDRNFTYQAVGYGKGV